MNVYVCVRCVYAINLSRNKRSILFTFFSATVLFIDTVDLDIVHRIHSYFTNTHRCGYYYCCCCGCGCGCYSSSSVWHCIVCNGKYWTGKRSLITSILCICQNVYHHYEKHMRQMNEQNGTIGCMFEILCFLLFYQFFFTFGGFQMEHNAPDRLENRY